MNFQLKIIHTLSLSETHCTYFFHVSGGQFDEGEASGRSQQQRREESEN